ncbi:MAG: flippase-like domain-containing protein [SAR202 cluster bacterium]|nr:flippase-like domain-containing protein [SAR202 cluster bacterium]
MTSDARRPSLPEAADSRRRPRFVRLLLWTGGGVAASALGAVFLYLAFRGKDWGAVNHALSQANLWYLFAAQGCVVLAYFIRGVRWRLLFRNVKVGTLRLVLVENTALGVNSLTPIPVLDEPVRVGLLWLQGLPAGTVLATMATMRTFELASQAVIGLVGLIYLEPIRPLKPYFIAATALAGVGLIALFTIGPLMKRVPVIGRIGLAKDFSKGVEVMREAPIFPFISFLLTAGYTIVIGTAGWLVGLAFDVPMDMLALIIVSLAVIFFTDWVPALPLAVGSFEFVALHLLGLWDVEPSTAFSFALLLHAIFFIPPLVIAVIYLPVAGIRSFGAAFRLVRPTSRSGNTTVIVRRDAAQAPSSAQVTTPESEATPTRPT